MDILLSVAVGLAVAIGAISLLRGTDAKYSGTLTVGVLGALLGTATHLGMGHEGIIDLPSSHTMASAYGATIALFLWIVAQRLFLQSPGSMARD